MEIISRRLTRNDAPGLAAFYNGLSAASKRTFRPLGETTDAAVCGRIAEDNETGGKYDLVSVDADAIVGWGFLWDLPTECPMLGLGIADAHQGNGLGRALMDALLTEARRIGLRRVTLTVVQDNERAWGLYERRGFVRQEAFVADDGLPYYRMEWSGDRP